MAPLARGVLLDLDGTLLDTAPDLVGSVNALRAERDLPPIPAGLLATAVSHGSSPLVRRGFDMDPADERFPGLRERLLTLYRDRVHDETRAFPGMDTLLAELDRLGVPWGIVTNKPGWLTRPLLEALGYSTRSGCLVTGDDLKLRKPHPYPVLRGCAALHLPPERCLVVGDAQRDVISGQLAGALTLVALFGYVHAEDRVTRWAPMA
ncbi:MAG: HAD-IA family hydrolase [Arhodomonas sp.]|nr:HAD-IA family hydrolase [Arhodomonas sp.]